METTYENLGLEFYVGRDRNQAFFFKLAGLL